ncbi:MAG: cysteine synthase family protein [Nitrosopumilaceae archaeon]|uniref:Cysteine synthase family protein n=1 Tax=Candidatus Nitrosomaritimum aestuariumsis TaxID=3342354 RepID=A0AC60WBH6_9ARCH|nr:cysteine synthase family protein [Nitrosopumilaceae archaeon]MBA4461388.1 cysteine synthase family protein [Nitrosopumilaceae archaeon]MBA4464241.1 cysteine synthase family protein [Nitrosopumilaceae archaeon]NCF22484.1 pyridoxal-phosphate dependent enzyme [Nitrosopumilaceae archaeon]
MATKAVTDADTLNRVGNTPLVKLESLSKNNTEYYAKLEGHNPFGSVKDRAAYWMIKDGEEKGILTKGKSIIIEPTSGNTGIALTGIANLLGYKVEIVIPEKASNETKEIIRNLGAKIFETSDDLCPKVGAGTDQSIALATSIASSRPDTYYSPNQYANEANFKGHYVGTGPEIWKQTEGKITHFFTGVGTGGTITGIGTYLKEKNPNIKIIGCQPQQDHLIQGWRNFEESAKPDLFLKREKVVDDWISADNQEAFSVVKEVFEKDKLLISPSSAAVYACMKKYPIEGDACVVGIFADDGRKFKSVYSDQKVMSPEEFDQCLKEAKHMSELAY